MDELGSWLWLDDVLAPPPWAALLSCLMLLGFVRLGALINDRWMGKSIAAIDRAAGLIAGIATVAVWLHGWALAGIALVTVARVTGALLLVAGVFEIDRLRRLAPSGLRSVAVAWHGAGWLERVALVLAGLTGLGLIAGAFGPATDMDSLDYHLAVPLDWLRSQRAMPRADWLHSRFAGAGEALNLLGLAMGTDSLGACLQAAGAWIAIVAVRQLAPAAGDRTIALLLVSACPLLSGSVFSQKFQLLPAAATTLAIVLVVSRRQMLDSRTLAQAAICVAFAAACKYTFLLTGGVVAGVMLALAWRRGQLTIAAGALAAAGVVLVLPFLLRNYFWYGDPLSPFLESWKDQPDPVVLQFAQYLRDYGSSRSFSGLAHFGLSLLATRHLGQAGGVLGLGVLAGILAWRHASADGRWCISAAAGAGAAILFFGQLTPRFFLEPYLWAAAGAASGWSGPALRLLRPLLVAQAVPAAGMALFGAATLAPGALALTQRELILEQVAEGYTVAKWLDRHAPPDALLMPPMIRITLPRPSIPGDLLFMQYAADLPASEQRRRVAAICAGHRGPLVMVDGNYMSEVFEPFRDWIGPPITGRVTFYKSSRNPFVPREAYELWLCELRIPANIAAP